MLWGPFLVKPADLALLEDIPEADFQDPIHRGILSELLRGGEV